MDDEGLSTKQVEAVNRCCDMGQSIVPVTGIAGTGKTTLMKTVAERVRQAGYTPVLGAPTGKAAKRITEATGLPAKTLHRMLEYPHPGDEPVEGQEELPPSQPRRHQDRPIEADVILADEYPMVPHEVHRNLINAMRPGSVLRVFGDVRQLKPIEQDIRRRKEPSSFQALLDDFDGIVLDKNFRQEEGSGIAENGERIVGGNAPKRRDDFELVMTEQPITVLEKVIKRLKKRYDFDFAGTDAQIITCANKSFIGSNKLNGTIQAMLHPEDGDWFELPRSKWDKNEPINVRIGDKIVWTQNNYDLIIFNGESGVIVDIGEWGEVTIDFGDRITTVPPTAVGRNKDGVEYTYDPRTSIDLGYAVTTHKAQGSEYKVVIYVLNRSTKFMQCRSNFYTAVTRARQHVVVITDQQSMWQSLREKSLMDERG